MIVVLAVGFSLSSPYFLNAGNIEALLGVNSVVMIAAVGMTVAFLVGGIDLSISTVISVSAVTAGLAMAHTDSVPIGIVTAIAVGLIFGAINGVLIGYFRLTPFITTMATQLIARGIAFVLSQGIAVKGTPYWMLDFGFALWFGIPAVMIVALIVVAVSAVALSQTTWGRHVMLVGSNKEAARYTGINVRFIEFSVYLFSGALAGVAGFISIANLGNAIPGVGDTLLLIVIGAVVLGGTGMTGGEGSVSRTVFGVLLLAMLANGLNLLGIPFYDQLIIQGVLIFLGTWIGSKLSGKRDS